MHILVATSLFALSRVVIADTDPPAERGSQGRLVVGATVVSPCRIHAAAEQPSAETVVTCIDRHAAEVRLVSQAAADSHPVSPETPQAEMRGNQSILEVNF